MRALHILFPLSAVLLLAGCDAAKYVPQGEHLLNRNRLVLDTHARYTPAKGDKINMSEVASIIKQKPNKRVLGVPFYLDLYNLRDPERVVRKRVEHDSLCSVDNLEREREGRKLKVCDHVTKGRNGEPPVVLDTAQTRRSADQIRMYLQKEGYFMAAVRDSVVRRKRKAEVIYLMAPGPAYTLCDVNWTVDESNMDHYVRESWGLSHLRVGHRFDADDLDKERDRITDLMRERGFLYFNRDLVAFDADTGMGGHEVDLLMRIERPMGRAQRQLKGTREGTLYSIERIIIDEDARASNKVIPDTLHVDGYDLLYRGERPRYKPEALLCGMFLHPDQRFVQGDADRTYRRLTYLRVFDRVDIRYDSAGTSAPDLVNCRILLIPGRTQSMSLEGFVTNRGGFGGTAISVGYKHKNLFRTMGSITASMNFGLEAQQSITGSTSGSGGDVSTDVGNKGLFNTVEFGPEVTLRFPNFLLPVKCGTFARSAGPRTTIGVLYNYQRRPDYIRSLAKFSFGYEWNESRTKTWGLFPVELNLIKIPYYAPSFLTFLQETNDPILTDSYTDHFIVGSKVVFTLNTQDVLPKRHTFYLRSYLETSGNLLRLTDRIADAPQQTDSTGTSYYTFLNIRYAQFVKVDNDFRYYLRIHDKSSVVFRATAGIGVPFGNLTVLPFETSFFGGGANGMRAWQARTLGPGSYAAPVSFDRIGDIHIEGNVEYRFKLVGYLEGALFTDIGNIWTIRENPAKPGSGFEGDFLSELGVGGGIGARLNFDFFLVRFDLAAQLKDPAQPPGERWFIQRNGDPQPIGRLVNLNLGIGYPF